MQKGNRMKVTPVGKYGNSAIRKRPQDMSRSFQSYYSEEKNDIEA